MANPNGDPTMNATVGTLDTTNPRYHLWFPRRFIPLKPATLPSKPSSSYWTNLTPQNPNYKPPTTTTTIPAISAAPTITKRSAHDDDDHHDKGKRQKKDEEEEEEEETTYVEHPGLPDVPRDFTPEEKYIYHKVMFESDFFDCVDVPLDVIVPGQGLLYPIHIDQLPYDSVKIYEDKAKLGLTAYNKLHGTSFQWVKVIKVTNQGYYPELSYITFQAKDDHVAGSTPQNFQTHVSTFEGVDSIEFCRFEQKPKPVEGEQRWFLHHLYMATRRNFRHA